MSKAYNKNKKVKKMLKAASEGKIKKPPQHTRVKNATQAS